MAAFHEQLLEAARQLIAAESDDPATSEACIRRSISTTYYALFHFLIDEACRSIVGSADELSRRRRVIARSFTHAGLKLAIEKVEGLVPKESVALLFQTGRSEYNETVPEFARTMAKTFVDAQAKRHDADYNLNEMLSREDAEKLVSRASEAILIWKTASSPEDQDFKAALCVLMLLRGQLRSETR